MGAIAGGEVYGVDVREQNGKPLLALLDRKGGRLRLASYDFATGQATSLDAKPLRAKLFYATIAVTTLLGAALNFTGIDPAKALYWAAVVNGVLAAPLMAAMMLIVRNPRAMGRLTLGPKATLLGWAATGVMVVATAVFFATL